MGDALSVAYIELQKAHMKDLLAKGVDDKLNSIVLFTDGVPSAVSLFLNNPANNNADNVISSTSGCNYKDIRTTNTTQKMLSWLAITGPRIQRLGRGWHVSSGQHRPDRQSHGCVVDGQWGIGCGEPQP